MTKLTCEIDLDWIDEEEAVSDVIKKQIISNVESRTVASLSKSIASQAEASISQKINDIVSTAIEQRINSYLEEPRNITDKWGEVTKENVTIEDLIREQLDKYVNDKTLDKNGSFTNSSHNQKHTILGYFMEEKLKPMIFKEIESMTKVTEEQIKLQVKDKIKTEVADKLTALIVDNSTTLALKT